MIRIVLKTLKFRGAETKISKTFLGTTPLRHKVSKFVCLDLSKMIRTVVKTLQI